MRGHSVNKKKATQLRVTYIFNPCNEHLNCSLVDKQIYIYSFFFHFFHFAILKVSQNRIKYLFFCLLNHKF